VSTLEEKEVQDLFQDTIKTMVNDQLIAHGYSKGKNGETVADEEKMKARAYELVSKKVVTSKDDKSKNAWTRGELYAAVFPNGPGTNPNENIDALSFEDAEVREKLATKVWNLTNPARNGYIQKRLGDDGGTLILCRSSVMRRLDPLVGVFVTDNADLIMADSLQPQVEKLVKTADNLRRHAEMIGVRHPELEGRLNAAVGSGINRTVAALPQGPSDPQDGGRRAASSDKPTK
jgi:hypothetical protein